MEDVVATVSGYHGSERFNLIKLISHSGASYVGAMSKSITHLVCWKFEGKKYSLAKKFNTIIVNHQWVEECIKQGRRVPEKAYTSQCGEEVGPLAIEIPAISEENKLAAVDKFRDKSCESRSAGFSELASWSDSILLKENVGSDAFSLRSTRKKRDSIFEGKANACLAESSRKGRRLAKKNTCKHIVDLESDQESDINRPNVLCDQQNNAAAPVYSDDENRNVGTAKQREASTHQLLAHSRTPNQGLDEIEETENWNHPSCFKVPRSSHADVSNNVERTFHDDGSNVNNPDSTTDEAEPTEKTVTIPPPAEVSCVICWTEFSSTRGILPCGHRFCYSCIQNWADRMVSQRKNSACPLCKAGFMTITKVEDAGSSDQKIYSQTVPCPSTKGISILPEQERLNFRFPPVASVCTRCFSREPEDLLIRCNICSYRCIHSYCLDPYLLPWTCTHCSDMQMLYRRGY